SQDSSSCPTQQNCILPEPNVLISNNVENLTIDYNISNTNEHQNVEFNSQEKLEIVPDSVFQNWDQLDRYIKMYAKQNSFVSIITCSEFDEATRRRCRYVCKNQEISYSKKTAIVENQKQSQTKRLGLKEEIKYYTSKGLNMQMQLSLLEDKYLDILFLPQDLSSTIQSFKKQNK
ncbi:119_t:CDS:2, partial [Racocetra persica]